MSSYQVDRNLGRRPGYGDRSKSRRGSYVRPSESFRGLDGYAGVDLLPRSLTINGVTKSPTFWYNGGDASGDGWSAEVGGASGDLTLQAGAVPNYNQGSPLGQQGNGGSNSTNDDSVIFNAGGYFKAGNSDFGQITTEDFVFELLFKTPALGGSERICGKWVTSEGYAFYLYGSGYVHLYLQGSGTVDITLTGQLAASSWYHLMAFGDRSGSCAGYLCGAAAGTPAVISTLSSLTTTEELQIGAAGDGLPYPGGIAQFAMWQGAAWLNSHSQDDLAAARFRQVRGLLAQYADGGAEPTASSRTSEAYVQRVEGSMRKLYYVGSGWGCVHEHPPGHTRAMVRREPAATNLYLQSQTMDTTWVPTNATISADAAAAPDGETVADALAEDGTTNVHYVSQTITLTATEYTFSVFGKKATRNVFRMFSGPGGGEWAFFNLNTGVKGTKTGGVNDHGMEAWGDGWYRCWMSFTGTAALYSHNLMVALDNETTSFLGLTQDSINFFGAQIELGTYPTSYIPTTSSSSTRNADSLRYEGLQNLGIDGDARRGRLSCDIWLPNAALGTDRFLWSANDGGSENDRIEVHVRASDGKAAAKIKASDGLGHELDLTGSTALNDGEIHRVELVWGQGEASLIVDGASEAAGSPTDCPDGLDTLDVGSDYAGNGGAIYLADLRGGPY